MMARSDSIQLLDCTLRDGGYYNAWDFDTCLINDYLLAMSALDVSCVELGFRSLSNHGFKGACAYTTDEFINSLNLPDNIRLGVMVNGSELVSKQNDQNAVLGQLFPNSAKNSPVSVVRIACHVHEFEAALPASQWLKDQGYIVGFNIMQIAGRSHVEVESLALEAKKWPIDVLYFADSMGSMDAEQIVDIIRSLRTHWDGELGVHTHDNMGRALHNALCALGNGATWLDSTVTGMGRGAGNAKTEYLALELMELGYIKANHTLLLTLIRKYFNRMQLECGWGTNTYYYLAGKYGIHPTYIQEMLADTRYDDEDILSVIEHLRVEGGKEFSVDMLNTARHFYQGKPRGGWNPTDVLAGREILILGSGPGVVNHGAALERYIKQNNPYVIALNTQSMMSADLIDARIACHPIRLLADCDVHAELPQPLITPFSMLPDDVRKSLSGKVVFDFGLEVQKNTFVFSNNYCVSPSSLVIAYALAVVNSGNSKHVMLAGFDGFEADDPRSIEMQNLFDFYSEQEDTVELCSITPTRFNIPKKSVYAM